MWNPQKLQIMNNVLASGVFFSLSFLLVFLVAPSYWVVLVHIPVQSYCATRALYHPCTQTAANWIFSVFFLKKLRAFSSFHFYKAHLDHIWGQSDLLYFSPRGGGGKVNSQVNNNLEQSIGFSRDCIYCGILSSAACVDAPNLCNGWYRQSLFEVEGSIDGCIAQRTEKKNLLLFPVSWSVARGSASCESCLETAETISAEHHSSSSDPPDSPCGQFHFQDYLCCTQIPFYKGQWAAVIKVHALGALPSACPWRKTGCNHPHCMFVSLGPAHVVKSDYAFSLKHLTSVWLLRLFAN